MDSNKKKKISNRNFNNKRDFNLFILFICLFIFTLFKPIKTLDKCSKENPIFKNNECTLEYCTKEEYANSICKIENEIIQTQWLTSVIWVGEKNFRYINIATYSNGDLIVETTSNPGTPQRVFYGLKRNGQNFFNDSGIFTPYYSTNVSEQDDNSGNVRYEAELFTAINKQDQKEYLISIPRYRQYMELFDFNNKTIYQAQAKNKILGSRMVSYKQSANNYTSDDNESYIIFSYASDKDKSSNPVSFFVRKFQLTSLSDNGFKNISSFEKGKEGDYKIISNSVSCFMTVQKNIICFYLSENDSLSRYYIIALDINFKNLSSTYIETSFSIHYKDEVGIFTFYNISDDFGAPYIFFKIFTSNNTPPFTNYFPSFSEIILKKKFIKNCLMNEIIKISEKKICYIVPSEEKEELYIVLLNIYETEKVIIRYFKIDIYKLYNLKFLTEISGHLYNNFISFAFSYCKQESCSNDDDEHYSAFLIFSYPNITEIKFDLEKYLFDNNIHIDDFEVNLKENIKIENNIFGLIYRGIIILNISNCENINLVSSISTTKPIEINTILEINEKIKIIFPNQEYYQIDCIIQYAYIVTEPNYEVYDTYTILKDETYGIDDEESFNKHIDIYEGKNGFYEIILKRDLEINNCQDPNCQLCVQNKLDYCITCKYNFTIEENEKFCEQNMETNAITEKLVEKEEEKKEEMEEKIKSEKIYISDEFSKEEEIKTDKTYISNEFTIFEEIKEEIDLTEGIIKEEKITNKIITTNDIENSLFCTKERIINNECVNEEIKYIQIKEVFNYLKDFIKDNYDKENNIYETKNAVFQISTLDDQKKNKNSGISSIDLGECENILKQHYNLTNNQSLIIIKLDFKNKNKSSTYVQYEVFEPINKTRLNLDYCSNLKIVINVPIDLDSETISLYERMNEQGYNLFNSNDSFYTDICTTYTTENGTDIILEDRKKEIYGKHANRSMCQSGCEFESYNKTTNKAKCKCDIQNEDTELDISQINFDFFTTDNIINAFLIPITNSNFLVLKCYKLALSLKNIFTNIGRMIMTIILLLFIIILFVYFIKDKQNIYNYIYIILHNKFNNNKNKENDHNKKVITERYEEIHKKEVRKIKNNRKEENKKKSLFDKKRIKTEINSNNKKSAKKNNDIKSEKLKNEKIKTNKNKEDKKDKSKEKKFNTSKNKIKNIKMFNVNKEKDRNIDNHKEEKSKNNKRSEPPRRKDSKYSKKRRKASPIDDIKNSKNSNYTATKELISDENISNQYINSKLTSININIFQNIRKRTSKPKDKINLNDSKKAEEKKIKNKKSIEKPKETKIPHKAEKALIKIENNNCDKRKFKNMNDQELNSLIYKLAIKYDKRTYFQYYWSLLKKKQLILFTFLPSNDYNLLTLKISLFLLSFSLYFTINAFFFTDETMHKIYKDYGNYNIIYQIPQILYSSIISTAINIILKNLSLSESNILKLKQEKDYKNARKSSEHTRKCLNIKFVIFLIISLSLLLFFWYFISCFCAVYINTQMILIKDTIFSFFLSMIYPFGLNLLPGIFRIPALRAKRKDRKCLYNFSSIVSLI
mgnify:CR=1 FL=1